jgi:enolase-phosphatase E1
VKAVVLDIEGTTTPIGFVTETLFPYARRHLREYLARFEGTSGWPLLVQRFRREHAADHLAGTPTPAWIEGNDRASIEAYAGWLMDRDRKSPALKDLQGRIWEEGYRCGDLVSDVFPDVPAALERWKRAGVPVAIYSSGSVLAQRWLFRCSRTGDLTPFLGWHFDTAVGPKTDAASYSRIAAAIGAPPPDILFVSDAVRELDAARVAGMRTTLMVRPGNAAAPAGHGHPIADSLDDLSEP